MVVMYWEKMRALALGSARRMTRSCGARAMKAVGWAGQLAGQAVGQRKSSKKAANTQPHNLRLAPPRMPAPGTQPQGHPPP
jgi:hypothetical protein